ncbi:MAG: aromatic ring-hydroxylating dioxygenase subunit alpha [Deltaproteobacteria bacterium]|nr:aromatic ring-hydroxylating dioxygenase subunit alpha [Deltaproteobacteria bacterium]
MKTVIADKRWVRAYPELGTGPIPAEPCISPAYFELERERVFRRAWLNMGRVEAIPKPGDYIVRELAVCNTSILLMRGDDGVVRGFHNVCSHRGNKLVGEEKGSCRKYLTCNFHGWSYDSQGQLKWVPDEENFFDLQKSQLGLTPVATEIWAGFIFINLTPTPQESLTTYLGGLAEQLGEAHFDELRLSHTYRVPEQANWKVGLDAQNEVYHLPFQHRYLLSDALVAKDNRYTRLLDVKFFRHHSMYSCESNPAHKPNASGVVMARLEAATTKCRLPLVGDFDFYTIFPNFAVLLLRDRTSDYFLTYNFWPLAVDRTIWEVNLYSPPAQNAGQRISQEYMYLGLRNALQEDAKAHETVHAGLASRAKTHFLLQDDEIQIRHFHKAVEDHVRF